MKRKPTTDGKAWCQLATRVEQKLHRAMKLHCVQRDLAIQDFIEAAIRAKLGKQGGVHA